MPLNSRSHKDDLGEYWKVQVELVNILGRLGFSIQATDRIPTFWFRLRLKQAVENGDQEILDEAVRLLDALVELRVRGVEPPNDGKRYV